MIRYVVHIHPTRSSSNSRYVRTRCISPQSIKRLDSSFHTLIRLCRWTITREALPTPFTTSRTRRQELHQLIQSRNHLLRTTDTDDLSPKTQLQPVASKSDHEKMRNPKGAVSRRLLQKVLCTCRLRWRTK